MKRFALALAALAAAVSTPAFAAQVYNAPDGLVGNQDWQGTLGLNFTVNSAIKVTSIGVFDSGGNGLTGTLFATIRNAAGLDLFGPVAFSGTANAAGDPYLFSAITPLILGPGSYSVAAWGFDGGDRNYNYGFIESGNGGPITFNSLGGRLTAISSSYANAPGALATIPDDGNTRYGAGSFLAAAVPEPATWALLIGGFAMIGSAMRRRKVRVSVAYA